MSEPHNFATVSPSVKCLARIMFVSRLASRLLSGRSVCYQHSCYFVRECVCANERWVKKYICMWISVSFPWHQGTTLTLWCCAEECPSCWSRDGMEIFFYRQQDGFSRPIFAASMCWCAQCWRKTLLCAVEAIPRRLIVEITLQWFIGLLPGHSMSNQHLFRLCKLQDSSTRTLMRDR